MKIDRILYASYGSLMHPSVFRNTIKEEPVVVGTGVILDYELTFRGYANIERKKYSRVPTVLYAVTKEQMFCLDKFESYPSLYSKKKVKVRTSAGTTLEAIAYVVNYPIQLEFTNGIDINYAKIVFQAYEINNFNTKIVSKAFSDSYARLKNKSR